MITPWWATKNLLSLHLSHHGSLSSEYSTKMISEFLTSHDHVMMSYWKLGLHLSHHDSLSSNYSSKMISKFLTTHDHAKMSYQKITKLASFSSRHQELLFFCQIDLKLRINLRNKLFLWENQKWFVWIRKLLLVLGLVRSSFIVFECQFHRGCVCVFPSWLPTEELIHRTGPTRRRTLMERRQDKKQKKESHSSILFQKRHNDWKKNCALWSVLKTSQVNWTF